MQAFGQIFTVTHSNTPMSLCEHRCPLRIGGANYPCTVSVQFPVWLLGKVLANS